MPYRNKTYVCFDGDNDIHCYRLMQAWKQHDDLDFNFHNAHELTKIAPWSSEESKKASLRERMKNSKLLVVLVGDNTRFCLTYVRWEIEQAVKMGLPIIAVNLNKKRSIDTSNCPKILRDELAIHIPYSRYAITHAMDNWPDNHDSLTREGKMGPYCYNDDIYRRIGVIA